LITGAGHRGTGFAAFGCVERPASAITFPATNRPCSTSAMLSAPASRMNDCALRRLGSYFGGHYAIRQPNTQRHARLALGCGDGLIMARVDALSHATAATAETLLEGDPQQPEWV
jgi:hypothetical protein